MIEKEVNERFATEELDSEAIQDLITSIEVESDLEHDPIAMLASEYSLRCFDRGIFKHTIEYFDEPPLPPISNMFDIESLRKRFKAMEDSVAKGCRISVETPSGVAVQEVLVRNFDTFGVDALGIAENIARFKAFKKALTLYAQ